MKKIILLILIILISYTKIAKAIDYGDDDSCITQEVITNNLKNDITSLGMFGLYSYFFDMKSAEGARCIKASDNIKFYFRVGKLPEKNKIYNIKAGEYISWHSPPAKARGIIIGNNLCVQFQTAKAQYQTIGCKPALDKPSKISPNKTCLLGDNCGVQAFIESRSLIPISSMVIECVKESIDRIFLDTSMCKINNSTRVNLFPAFQNSMRDIIRALLVIYVIFYGIKLILVGKPINKKEAFLFVFKFIIVTYFAVGLVPATVTDGRFIHHDGTTKFLRPLFEGAVSSFSDIVYKATEQNGLCAYHTSEYNHGYKYFALWDAIDCRILHYLGFDIDDDLIEEVVMSAIPIVSIILAAAFSFKILFMIVTAVFGIFLLSIFIFFIHVFAIALIGLAIITFTAPIFIPLALFNYTKHYFDAWLSIGISFALQPMVITAFISFMIIVFDQTMYADCKWERKISFISRDIGINVSSSGEIYKKPIPIYSIDLKSASKSCKESYGYQFESLKDAMVNSVSAMLFFIPQLNNANAGKLWSSLLAVALYIVLFYQFVKDLSQFAGDLTSGPAVGRYAVDPRAVFDHFMKQGKNKFKEQLMGDEENKDSGTKVSENNNGGSAKVSEGNNNNGSDAKVSSK